MTTRTLLLSEWHAGWAVPLVCVVALAGYALRFRHALDHRASFFALSVALFFVALASPIGILAGGYLFCAHMLQHLLLVLAVPPLILLGLPRERGASSSGRTRDARAYLAHWSAGTGAMWIWHARPLCNAAAVNPGVQALQTFSLVAMGLAFWWPILAPRTAERMPPFPALVYLFAGCVACTILGIALTLSPVEVCSAYTHPPDALGVLDLVRNDWGLTCRADQEIGGLLMWVPTCLVYVGAILSMLARYYGEEPAMAETSGGGR